MDAAPTSLPPGDAGLACTTRDHPHSPSGWCPICRWDGTPEDPASIAQPGQEAP